MSKKRLGEWEGHEENGWREWKKLERLGQKGIRNKETRGRKALQVKWEWLKIERLWKNSEESDNQNGIKNEW